MMICVENRSNVGFPHIFLWDFLRSHSSQEMYGQAMSFALP